MRRPQITTYVIARNVPTQKPHKTCRTRECRCANPARRSGGRAGFAHGAHASSGTQAICRPLQTFLIAPWRLSVRNGTSSSLERLLKNTPAWGDGPASLADFLGNHCRPRALRRRIPDFFNSLSILDRSCTGAYSSPQYGGQDTTQGLYSGSSLPCVNRAASALVREGKRLGVAETCDDDSNLFVRSDQSPARVQRAYRVQFRKDSVESCS